MSSQVHQSDVSNPREMLVDRELSWLAFNQRVLELAEDKSIPLLERCRFLAIFSSNLDDFYMIRVASLKNKLEPEVIAERVESLSSLADEMVSERARMRIGQRVRVLIEDAELQEGRAAHQGPEVDGTTSFIGTNFKVGEYVDAVVIESVGADLVAEAE